MGNKIEKINKALTPLEYDKKINEIIDLIEEGGVGGIGVPIGTILPIHSNMSYVPEGTVPCNGHEYTKAQFPALWDNYLRGEGDFSLGIIDKFRAVDYNDTYTLGGYNITPVLSSRDTSGYSPTMNHISGEQYKKVVLCLTYSDVTACQSIISGHNGATALYIENGNICTHSIKTEAATTWTVNTLKAVTANTPFYIKAESYMYEGDVYNYRYLNNYFYSSDGITWESLTTDESLMATHSFYMPLQSWFSNEIRNGETYTTTTATIDGYNSYIIDEEGAKHRIVQPTNYTQNRLITCSYIEYDKEVAQTGQCSKFAIDLELETFKVPTILSKMVTSTKDIATVEYDLTCLNSQRFRYPAADSTGKINSLSGGTMDSDNTVGFSPFNTSSITSENFGITAFNGTNRKTIEGATTPAISGTWVKMNIDPNETWIADLSKTRPAIEIHYYIVIANGQTNKTMMDWEAWNTSLTNKASKSDVDGQWVTDIIQVLNTAGTLTQVEVDLSEYLPDDGYDYEVKFKLAGYDNDSTYGYYIDTDKWVTSTTPIQSDDGISSVYFHIYGGTYARQTVNIFDLPVGVGRYARVTGQGGDNVYLTLLGYRRIGKNK